MSDSSIQDDVGGNHLKSIWDDPHVEKLPTEDDGQRQWKCLWCSLTFNQWNGTKAVYHLNQVKGYSIKPCASNAIDDDSKRRYSELMKILEAKRKRISNKRVANMIQYQPSSDSSNESCEESVATPTEMVKVGSVWEDDKIMKWSDQKGQKFWRCLWCDQRFSQWNATKTIHHLNRRKGCDIKPCSAENMDEEHKIRYASLMVSLEAKRRKKTKKLQCNVEQDDSDEYTTSAAPLPPLSTSITPSSSPRPRYTSGESGQYCTPITSSSSKKIQKKKRSRKDMESEPTPPSGRVISLPTSAESTADEDEGDNTQEMPSDLDTKPVVSPPSIGPLNSIWDDNYVIRTRRPTGEKCWKCLWCNRVFSQHNATKAIYHVNQYRGNDIQPCTSKDIDEERKKQYKGLMEALKNKRKKQKLQRKGKDIFSSFVEKIIEQHEEEVANKLVNFIEQ
ncbi:unnamed protein product [Cylindrotheca closterium]|uniref:Uncharacterized protein n=1 Tax=Cylindrotheca closterium TaxID=2856 RepID=A0AAD2G9W3_9STRA|nr:unnamed protein product [Cylindrotheca closterium]